MGGDQSCPGIGSHPRQHRHTYSRYRMKAVGEGGALDELSEVKQPKPAGPWGQHGVCVGGSSIQSGMELGSDLI